MLTEQPASAESELRWQAWLAKGRIRDLRTRHRARVLGFVVLVAVVVALGVFVLA